MAVTEERIVENPSWVQRLGSSFRGVLIGFVLFIAGFPILFWNEGRAVDTAKRLNEGAGAVVDVPADKIDPANEGKLVHVSGKADTQDVLSDDVFGVSANALRLKRLVEVYQVVEEPETKRVKEGNKTREITTYNYSYKWCAKPEDSSKFHEAAKRAANPPAAMPFSDEEKLAANVALGAFRLSAAHVKRIGEKARYAYPTNYVVPASVPGGHFQNGYIYVPYAPAAPVASAPVPASSGVSPLLAAAQAAAAATNAAAAVANAASAALVGGRSVAVSPVPGDVRVRFEVVLPHDVTVVERQEGDTLAPWAASDGETLSFVRDGRLPAAKIFADAQSTNSKITWLLRLAGLLAMFFGLKMVLGPIDTLVDVIPILNGIVSLGTSLVAGLVSGACSLLTIGVAWLFYRPWIGAPLVIGGVALLVAVYVMKKKAASVAPRA